MSAYANGFNKANLKLLRAAMDAALRNIQPNVEFQIGNIKFTQGECTIKVTAKIKGVEGVKDNSTKLLEQMAGAHGLDLSKTARIDGRTVRLVGYEPKKWKRPYVIEDVVAKKRFVVGEDWVKLMFRGA